MKYSVSACHLPKDSLHCRRAFAFLQKGKKWILYWLLSTLSEHQPWLSHLPKASQDRPRYRLHFCPINQSNELPLMSSCLVPCALPLLHNCGVAACWLGLASLELHRFLRTGLSGLPPTYSHQHCLPGFCLSGQKATALAVGSYVNPMEILCQTCFSPLPICTHRPLCSTLSLSGKHLTHVMLWLTLSSGKCPACSCCLFLSDLSDLC